MSNTTIRVRYNNRPIVIRMGYDNFTAGYFMVIEPVDETNPDADRYTGLIYTNLDDKELPFPGVTGSLEHYKKILRDKNIEVPPEYFGKVLAEAA